jgi:hypothetical protein
LIDKENLIRYGNHALTYRIVDRIFSQVCVAVALDQFTCCPQEEKFSSILMLPASLLLSYSLCFFFFFCLWYLFVEDMTSLFCLFLISSQVSRKFTSKVEGKMGYEDFVYFILSEEDKSSEPSLEYW